MLLKRRTLLIACLLLAIAWAGPAFAQKTYLLGSGSGAQLQIGGGLPLPIQLTDANGDMTPDWGGAAFPPLLVPKASAGVTVMDTAGTSNAALTIPATVLSRPASLNTLGVFAQNTMLYAVGTNLRFRWPAAAAMIGPRTMTPLFGGGSTTKAGTLVFSFVTSTRKAVYKNAAASPIGGVARFAITGVAAGGPYASLPVTVYAIGGGAPGAPPCTHTMHGGGNPACVALILAASPAGSQAPGGTVGVTIATTPMAVPMGVPNPVKAGMTPLGTILAHSKGAGTPTLMNTAASTGFPWTTGMVTVSAMGAVATPEVFVLTGSNGRNATGVGTIQLVSGSVSTRVLSGPNANRGWVRLDLFNTTPTPSIQGVGLAILAGCLLTTAVVTTVRRRRAETGA